MDGHVPRTVVPNPSALEAAPQDLSSLVVRPILAEEERTWDDLMAAHHYLGFHRLTGESLKYVAMLDGALVALVGWGAAAFACGPRDQWIGWSPEQRWRRLRFLANNQRFLILPGVRVKNLASRVLALNARRLSEDWKTIFGHPILLAETFVDQSRFAGTCYRAAGWIRLGESRGYGRSSGRYHFHGQPKTIWVRPLHPAARDTLAAPFDPPLLGGGKVMVDLNALAIEQEGGLLDLLGQLPDPRKRRGIRHSQVSILAVAVCACLAGARSFLAIGQWAAQLPQELLRRLGCRFHPVKRRYLPPSEPTIRRALQSIDPDLLDGLLGRWLANQADGDAVAVDGKTLRGARRPGGGRVHLMAALVHKEGVVVAQREVGDKSNEIKAVKPLLESVDLEGKVLTADAMHAQAELARYLVEQKGADYLFTVKANQPTMLADIKLCSDEDFSPSAP